MRSLSSIRRKLETLEHCQASFDPAHKLDAYRQVRILALSHLSREELDLLLREASGLNGGRQLGRSKEEVAALKAAHCSVNDAIRQECERFGITVAQLNERRRPAKPPGLRLKQRYRGRTKSRTF
jgi:hypothetical protein